ncbi:hypothetical protein DSO57_1032207 [Entomophthora muscae]|uniref:Uncharacterized protein n=1 Tax=Entomophthora muscae TaxID=34485 RepID=A0ACC2SDE0_9FUNG|nr:hypothetical protein DSO57_1032207 [Entomophthora muscae]
MGLWWHLFAGNLTTIQGILIIKPAGRRDFSLQGGLCNKGVAVCHTPGITQRQELSRYWESGEEPELALVPGKTLACKTCNKMT